MTEQSYQPRHSAEVDRLHKIQASVLGLPSNGLVNVGEYRTALGLAFKALTDRDAEIHELSGMLSDFLGHGIPLAEVEAEWAKAVAMLRDHLLTCPEGHALYKVATQIHAEFRAEIARLRRELDGYQNRTVYHCLDRDMAAIISGEMGVDAGPAEDGAILRATDTGREMERKAGAWLPRG